MSARARRIRAARPLARQWRRQPSVVVCTFYVLRITYYILHITYYILSASLYKLSLARVRFTNLFLIKKWMAAELGQRCQQQLQQSRLIWRSDLGLISAAAGAHRRPARRPIGADRAERIRTQGARAPPRVKLVAAALRSRPASLGKPVAAQDNNNNNNYNGSRRTGWR